MRPSDLKDKGGSDRQRMWCVSSEVKALLPHGSKFPLARHRAQLRCRMTCRSSMHTAKKSQNTTKKSQPRAAKEAAEAKKKKKKCRDIRNRISAPKLFLRPPRQYHGQQPTMSVFKSRKGTPEVEQHEETQGAAGYRNPKPLDDQATSLSCLCLAVRFSGELRDVLGEPRNALLTRETRRVGFLRQARAMGERCWLARRLKCFFPERRLLPHFTNCLDFRLRVNSSTHICTELACSVAAERTAPMEVPTNVILVSRTEIHKMDAANVAELLKVLSRLQHQRTTP